MGGTNPTTMLEGLTNSSLPLGRNLNLENTKLILETYSNVTRDNGLVNTSAIYSFVSTYWSFNSPLCTISLI